MTCTYNISLRITSLLILLIYNWLNTHLDQTAVALPLVVDLHQWMVFADGMISVGDPHWLMVLVDGQMVVMVIVPVVCNKLVERSRKHRTKFGEKLKCYMFSEKTNVIIFENLRWF